MATQFGIRIKTRMSSEELEDRLSKCCGSPFALSLCGVTVLKALLNHAWREGMVANDAAWRRVTPYKGVEEARLRYLSQEECVRLVNACDPDFRPLVQAALYTGCRYGELITLRVADFNADAGTLLIRQSKSRKARHVVLTEKGQEFFAVLASKGRADDYLLVRGDGMAWGKSHQTRSLADACANGMIEPAHSPQTEEHFKQMQTMMDQAMQAKHLGQMRLARSEHVVAAKADYVQALPGKIIGAGTSGQHENWTP